jgi:hypothetical protein
MFDSESLYGKIVAARGAVDEEVMPMVTSVVVESWQARRNNALVTAVMRGETTFSEAFEPLAQANLNIDPRTGTDASFAETAKTVGSAFEGVLDMVGCVRMIGGSPGAFADLTQGQAGRKAIMKGLVRFALAIGTGAALLLWGMLGFKTDLASLAVCVAAFVLLALVVVFGLGSNFADTSNRRAYVEEVRRRAKELDSFLAPLNDDARLAA